MKEIINKIHDIISKQNNQDSELIESVDFENLLRLIYKFVLSGDIYNTNLDVKTIDDFINQTTNKDLKLILKKFLILFKITNESILGIDFNKKIIYYAHGESRILDYLEIEAIKIEAIKNNQDIKLKNIILILFLLYEIDATLNWKKDKFSILIHINQIFHNIDKEFIFQHKPIIDKIKFLILKYLSRNRLDEIIDDYYYPFAISLIELKNNNLFENFIAKNEIFYDKINLVNFDCDTINKSNFEYFYFRAKQIKIKTGKLKDKINDITVLLNDFKNRIKINGNKISQTTSIKTNFDKLAFNTTQTFILKKTLDIYLIELKNFRKNTNTENEVIKFLTAFNKNHFLNIKETFNEVNKFLKENDTKDFYHTFLYYQIIIEFCEQAFNVSIYKDDSYSGLELFNNAKIYFKEILDGTTSHSNKINEDFQFCKLNNILPIYLSYDECLVQIEDSPFGVDKIFIDSSFVNPIKYEYLEEKIKEINYQILFLGSFQKRIEFFNKYIEKYEDLDKKYIEKYEDLDKKIENNEKSLKEHQFSNLQILAIFSSILALIMAFTNTLDEVNNPLYAVFYMVSIALILSIFILSIFKIVHLNKLTLKKLVDDKVENKKILEKTSLSCKICIKFQYFLKINFIYILFFITIIFLSILFYYIKNDNKINSSKIQNLHLDSPKTKEFNIDSNKNK